MDSEWLRETVGSVSAIILVVVIGWFGFTYAADADAAIRGAEVGSP